MILGQPVMTCPLLEANLSFADEVSNDDASYQHRCVENNLHGRKLLPALPMHDEAKDGARGIDNYCRRRVFNHGPQYPEKKNHAYYRKRGTGHVNM